MGYGFIWTMWDVKLSSVLALVHTLHPFYMNYVGCKALFVLQFVSCVLGFIWTMWDVKFGIDVVAPSSRKRFIWTMWDVKLQLKSHQKLLYQVLYELCGM